MPNWTLPAGSIKPLVAYHGTDDKLPGAAGLPAGAVLPDFRVNLRLCRPHTDFGQGFYVTTSAHQAKQWANDRWLRTPSSAVKALVLRFELDHEWLASLETVAFVRPTQGFWDLVNDCRLGFAPHQRLPPNNPPLDVVYGPVTLGRQKLVIQDCDQISFHTPRAVASKGLRQAWIHDIGNPTF